MLYFADTASGALMLLTGAEIVIRSLQEEKVEYLFGYPGGSVLYIYDELFKQDKVRHVLVRHEQAATWLGNFGHSFNFSVLPLRATPVRKRIRPQQADGILLRRPSEHAKSSPR